MDHLKVIKSIVFLFTFLIIAGSMALLGVFTAKVRSGEKLPEEINLQEPEGSSIRQIAANEEGMLYLLVSGGNKADRVIIYNLHKRQKLSDINLYGGYNNE